MSVRLLSTRQYATCKADERPTRRSALPGSPTSPAPTTYFFPLPHASSRSTSPPRRREERRVGRTCELACPPAHTTATFPDPSLHHHQLGLHCARAAQLLPVTHSYNDSRVQTVQEANRQPARKRSCTCPAHAQRPNICVAATTYRILDPSSIRSGS